MVNDDFFLLSSQLMREYKEIYSKMLSRQFSEKQIQGFVANITKKKFCDWKKDDFEKVIFHLRMIHLSR